LLLLPLIANGCKPVDPAPDDLDGLFHYVWEKYDQGLDEEIAEAVVNAHHAVDADDLEEVVDGSLEDPFTREDMDVVGMRDDADPDELAGMYLVNRIDCTLAEVEDIITRLNQDELYTGNYEDYDRQYTSDLDDYLAREATHLTWDVDIRAEFFAGAMYEEFIHGGVRYTPSMDAVSPHGPVVIARTWMPDEAEFENDDFYFTQDYQLEIYYEPDPGDVVHLYALWRYSGWLDADTNSDTLVRGILNALYDWDVRTEELCATGDYG